MHKNTANSGQGSGGGPPPGAAAIATYLGLTADQIRTQLESGKTLAAIAAAQGKTVSGLEDAIVADATTQLDAAVTAGKLTAAEEATMLAKLKAHVDELVNSTGPGGPGRHRGGPASQAIAAYLGLTSDQIRTQLESGKTLADIATAQGKTVSGLEDAIVADAKTHLEAAVAAGKLTDDQETSLLASIKSHVADMVTSTGAAFAHRIAGGRGGLGAGAAFGHRMAARA